MAVLVVVVVDCRKASRDRLKRVLRVRLKGVLAASSHNITYKPSLQQYASGIQKSRC